MLLRTRNRRRSARLDLSFWVFISGVRGQEPGVKKATEDAGRRARSHRLLSPVSRLPLLADRGERLPFLAADDFVLVPVALALVRLRLAAGADLGGELADGLLVGPADDDRGRVRHRDGQARRRFVVDPVRVPDGQLDALALGRRL